MKKNIILALLIVITLASSCKDATLTPPIENNDTLNLIKSITGKVWYLDSCQGDKTPYLTVFKVQGNGKFTNYSNYQMKQGAGDFEYDSIQNNYTLKFTDINFNYNYKVFAATTTSLEIGYTTDGGITYTDRATYRTIKTKSNEQYRSVTIYGDIINPANIDLGTNPHVYLMFTRSTNADGTGGENMYNYIEGTVDVNAKKYQINVVGEPDEAVIRKYSPNGQLAFGEIILTNSLLPVNTIVDAQLNGTNYLGAVNNIGLVWKSGEFSDGTNFNWRDAFNNGWTLGYGNNNNPYEPNKQIQSWIAPRHWEIPHRNYGYTLNNQIIVTKDIKKQIYPLEWFR